MRNLEKLSPFRLCSIFRHWTFVQLQHFFSNEIPRKMTVTDIGTTSGGCSSKKWKMTLASFIHSNLNISRVILSTYHVGRPQRRHNVESTWTKSLYCGQRAVEFYKNLNNLPWRWGHHERWCRLTDEIWGRRPLRLLTNPFRWRLHRDLWNKGCLLDLELACRWRRS